MSQAQVVTMTIRYPDGSAEYRLGEALRADEVVHWHGASWVVDEVVEAPGGQTTVHVRRASARSSGNTTTPRP